jgi:hypothetical protein
MNLSGLCDSFEAAVVDKVIIIKAIFEQFMLYANAKDCEVTNNIPAFVESFEAVDVKMTEQDGIPAAFSLMTSAPQQHANQDITISYGDGSYVGAYIIDEKTGQALPHGYGKRTWDDGSFYEGEFIRNVRCGRGTYTSSSGAVTTANWKENEERGGFKLTYDQDVIYGYKDGENAYIERVEFNSGYIFEGTLNKDLVKGTLTHPDNRSGRFVSTKEHGLTILSGDDDIRREILKFPDIKFSMLFRTDGIEYKGEVRDKTPHGYGQYIFPNDMILEVRSDMGNIADNRGIWTFPTGTAPIESLECVWDNGKWHGACSINETTIEIVLSQRGDVLSVKETYPDSSWVEYTNAPDGYEMGATYSSGEDYKGDRNWLTKSGNARGVYKDTDGNIWDGEWVDGIRNGSFTVTATDGKVSNTAYKDDAPYGHCVISQPNGAVLEYDWPNRNNVFDYGNVKLTLPDNSVYEGGFNGLPNGYGVLTLTDGTTYEGTWADGRFENNGVYIDLTEKWK